MVPLTMSPLGPVFHCSRPFSSPKITKPWPNGGPMDILGFCGPPRGLVIRPPIGTLDPLLEVSEPLRGLLSDRHPTEPPQHYTAEESRILCLICRLPEISRHAHQNVSLHRSVSLLSPFETPSPRPPQPPTPKAVEAAITLLRPA
ncbi:hypothetical protein MRX96_041385 [Rhipicephalus microplus]